MATKKRVSAGGSSKKGRKTAKKAVRKPAKAKKTTVRKSAKKVARKTTAKTAKKAPAKKSAPKKAAKPAAKVKTAAKKTQKAAAVKKAANGARAKLKKALTRAGKAGDKKLSTADRRALKSALQELRDRVVDEISFLSGDNLNLSQRDSSGDLSSYSIHMADQGTDNFDREFALNLVSSEQDILYEIDEALQRLDEKTYGVCQACNEPIEKARLEALPFARMCVKCKSIAEKGKTRYRPFGPTISQSNAAAAASSSSSSNGNS